MDSKHGEQFHAHELYQQTDLSQQQIADILNVNRKTLYGWIKEGQWYRAKYAAAHAPSVLVEQYYAQLGALNLKIAQREEQPWPTKEEADVIRKLTSTIKQVRNEKKTCSETIGLFHLFVDKLRKKDIELSKKLMPHMSLHIKDLSEEGRWLNYSQLRKEEEKFDKEYETWIKSQQVDEAAPAILPANESLSNEGQAEAPPTDVISPSPLGEGRGEASPAPLCPRELSPNEGQAEASPTDVASPSPLGEGRGEASPSTLCPRELSPNEGQGGASAPGEASSPDDIPKAA